MDHTFIPADVAVERDGFRVEIGAPILHVNNELRGRSGHMSHAMVEKDGAILAFNSNCSPVRCRGHAAYGWIEYRYSHNGGKTFSEPVELPYSKEAFLNGLFTVSVEKAVVCPDGTLIAFCLRNTMLAPVCCEPWFTPTVIRSHDFGKTWEPAVECSPYRGRIYDAVIRDGIVYFLQFCNDGEKHFCGNLPEHVYRLFVSTDGGKTFSVRSVLPGDCINRGYGALQFAPDGTLHAYRYNLKAEREMDHLVSCDNGQTWELLAPCYLEKGIRNPQTAVVNGIFLLHGRGEKDRGFVFYTSPDGTVWDDGVYLETEKKLCYYSNNLVLRDGKREHLLVQYSDVYRDACVNVMHRFVTVERQSE